MKIYVVDTNIPLRGIEAVKELSNGGENIIVIPGPVIQELEAKKKDITDLGFAAREFARFLSSSTIEKKEKYNDYIIVKIKNGDIKLHLFNIKKYIRFARNK